MKTLESELLLWRWAVTAGCVALGCLVIYRAVAAVNGVAHDYVRSHALQVEASCSEQTTTTEWQGLASTQKVTTRRDSREGLEQWIDRHSGAVRGFAQVNVKTSAPTQER